MPKMLAKHGKVIGLTGGIAAGKSAAAKILERMGCMILDADKLGHETYRKGKLPYQKIVNLFGHEVLDQNEEIDRKKLGTLVFADNDKLRMLCEIVWPEIKSLCQKKITQFKSNHPQTHIILEAAVLIEAGWEKVCDEVWVIYVQPELAIRRLVSRNNLSTDAAKARIAAQISNSDRLLKADKSYENNGSLEELHKHLVQMLKSGLN